MKAVTTRRHGQPATAGYRIGILTLDTRHILVHGNVQHAESFTFPVRYQAVRGIELAALMRGDRRALPGIVMAARQLEAMGVCAIVGACGSFAHFQREIAEAVSIPVVMSIMLEVPFVLRALPKHRRLGIIFARVRSFTGRVCTQCGIDERERIVALGAERLSAFQPILAQADTFDSAALECELVAMTARALKEDPSIGAWLLQCSDLPPYSSAIARATGLAVFDMVSLIEHLGRVLRPPMFDCRK